MNGAQIHFELFGRARRGGIAVPPPFALLDPVRPYAVSAWPVASALLPESSFVFRKVCPDRDLHPVQCRVSPSVVHGEPALRAEIHSATGQIHGVGKSISELGKAPADERGR